MIFGWLYLKRLTLGGEELLFALWFIILLTLRFCMHCAKMLQLYSNCKTPGMFQWFWSLWSFSLKGLTLDFEEQLLALWQNMFRIYDSVWTAAICCNMLQPYSILQNTRYFRTKLVIFLKGLTLGCEEQLLALWSNKFWIYDSACIAATTRCNHIPTAKRLLFSNGYDDFLTKIEVWLSRNVKKSRSMWWPLGCNPLIMELLPYAGGCLEQCVLLPVPSVPMGKNWLGRKASPSGRDGTGK